MKTARQNRPAVSFFALLAHGLTVGAILIAIIMISGHLLTLLAETLRASIL